MDKKVVRGIFELFNMSTKTEQQIVDIMKADHNSKEVCTLGVSFLKSEEEILKVMGSTYYDEKVCEAAIKALHLENKTENEILTFISKVEANGNQKGSVIRPCIPYLKLDELREFQILNLLRKTKYEYYIRTACIEALIKKIESFNDEQLLSVIELTDFNEDILALCIKYFKSEKQILKLIRVDKTPSYIISSAATLIKWEEKNEDQILEVLEKVAYNSSFCESGIKFFETEKNILFVLEKTENDSTVTELAIPLLKLESKSKTDLMRIIINSNYNSYICDECFNHLELAKMTESEILGIIKASNYNSFVSMNLVCFLKNEMKNILDVVRKTQFNVGVCRASLPLLKVPSDIYLVLSGSNFDPHVCEKGISSLKTEDEIFSIMEKTKFHYDVCNAGVLAMEGVLKKRAKRLNK